jgi:hypothetical protein
MPKARATQRSTQEVLAELAEARDAARLRLHLLSMEARERWVKLEATLQELEGKLCGEPANAREALKAAREAIRAVKELLKRDGHDPHAGPNNV